MAGTAASGRPGVQHQIETRGEQTPPEIPTDLEGSHAIALWQQAVTDLPHCLRQADFAILRLACETYQRAMDGFAAGDEKSALAATRLYNNLAREIGLTPSARRIVKPAPGEKQEMDDDAFEQWLARGGLN